uniref:C40 family peptidase n=1 Tax=Roseivirga sp. TaxID=1964215 RepID=UPI004048D1A6
MNRLQFLRHSLLFLFFVVIISSCAGGAKSSIRKSDIVIQTAKSYLGTPYKYGGTTRVGMDCSALLYHSFRSVNLKLPRTSEDQSKLGAKINIKDLRPGDMVFFATGKSKNEITHAGIVTVVMCDSDIRFIHASTSLGVTESNLFSTYYIQRFKRAKRVL